MYTGYAFIPVFLEAQLRLMLMSECVVNMLLEDLNTQCARPFPEPFYMRPYVSGDAFTWAQIQSEVEQVVLLVGKKRTTRGTKQILSIVCTQGITWLL